MTKSAPVEYVKICSVHGVGFFYIPGTDTCIKIGGRAQFQYIYNQYRSLNGLDKSAFIGAGRIQVDARTTTAWGTLRTFVRLDVASRTGQTSGASATLRAYGPSSFNATGIDTYNRAYKWVDADKAFIQFAGLTAGRASSFYDFYVTDIELSNTSITSNASSTNLLAYTAQLGGGWSTTLSLEDPTFRRNPLFSATPAFNAGVPAFSPNTGFYASAGTTTTFNSVCASGVAGCSYGTPIYLFSPAGQRVGYAFVDIAQRENLPDVVANLRVDQSWGSAQISGALHQVSIGPYVSGAAYGTTGVALTSAQVASLGGAPRSDAAWGYAIQGGVKLKLPFLAPGDALWLQAAYARGALAYTGLDGPIGRDGPAQGGIGGGTSFNAYKLDGYVDPYSGAIRLTTSWSVAAALLHYWAPQWRSGFVFTYGQLGYPGGARLAGPLANVYASAGGFGPVTAASATAGAYSVAFKDWNEWQGLGNLVWSPAKDLDMGVEVLYQRIDPQGRVYNNNRGGATTGATTGYQDNWSTRLRIERTF